MAIVGGNLQGSASISSADFFGHDEDDSNVDITASDLINRLSFQVKSLFCFFLRFYTFVICDDECSLISKCYLIRHNKISRR